MSSNEKKSLLCVSLAAGIILPAVFFFSTMGDLPHVFLMVAAGLLLSMFSRKPVKFNDRSVIYFVVLSVTMAVLFDYAFPLKDDRFGFLSVFFHPELFVPIVLLLAVSVSFFRSGPHVYGAAGAAAMLALAFGGDVFDTQKESLRVPMLTPLVKNFPVFYIVSVSVVIFFILLAVRYSENIKLSGEQKKYRLRKRILMLTMFILLPLVAIGAWRLYKRYEPQIRKLENMIIRRGLKRMRRHGKLEVFSREVDLNRTISPEMLQDQQRVVMRVTARRAPGYMRGRAYTSYRAGIWSLPKEATSLLKSRGYKGVIAYKTFFWDKPEKSMHAFEVLLAPGLITKVLLFPGRVEQFDIIADRLAYTRDGVITPEEWNRDGGYTVYESHPAQEAAWPQPRPPKENPEHVRDYLDVPDRLIAPLDEILEQIPALRGEPRYKLPDQRIFTLLLGFFREKLSYKIMAQNNGSKDPVIHFLTKTRQGHCELFASSMALLLRRLNIPTRYVTGFICEEKHPDANYYVSRRGNAHAWLEAYDRQAKRWMLLEPTPPTAVPAYRHEWGTFEPFGDVVKKFFQQLLSDLRRGYFARAIVNFFSGIFSAFAALVWHPVRGLIFLLLAAGAIYIYLRKRRSRLKAAATRAGEPAKTVRELSAVYRKILKKVRKYPEVQITRATTIAELTQQLRQAGVSDRKAEELRQLLIEYQAVRYREIPPSAEQVKTFRSKLSKRKKG